LPSRTPQAPGRRTALLTFLAATLMYAAFSASAARAQTPVEGTVRLTPALSTVPGAGGPFTVYIVAENIQHIGTINYDDDRDGTPDRSEASNGLAAFEFTIEYDPAILAVGGVERGPHLDQSGRSFQCLAPGQGPGSFTYGCVSTGSSVAGPQGTMTLASIELLPRGPGLSLLSLDAELAGPLGDAVSVAISGGAARVSGPVATATRGEPTSGVATAEPNETVADTQTPLATMGSPAATVMPTGTLEATPTTGPGDSNGTFGGVAFWVVVAGGSVGAGLLGLTAMLWRERSRRGT